MPLEYFKIILKDGEEGINIAKLEEEKNKVAYLLFIINYIKKQ